MPNLPKVKPKTTCDRLRKSNNANNRKKEVKIEKSFTPKITVSKTSKDAKCCSAGALSSYSKNHFAKPKKTTKSDLCFLHKAPKPPVVDYCKKCGDQIDNKASRSKEKPSLRHSKDANIVQVISGSSSKSSTASDKSGSVKLVINGKSKKSLNISSSSKSIIENNKSTDLNKVKYTSDDNKTVLLNGLPVQQFYKNENFRRRLSKSAHEISKYLRKISLLDTIKELPESKISDDDSDGDSVFEIYSLSDESVSDENIEDEKYSDDDEHETLKKLKEFRDDNYFETHSAQSRIKSKSSATNLIDHKCVYRFYLNDRLFPVPLHTDHHNSIRCSECHLPLDLSKSASKNINGTIQAKVKLANADKAQDMVLILPVKEPLIIKQKRKEPAEEEVVYFGVIKLDSYGNSIFNQTLPSNSLALKYQKGYREFKNPALGYEYKKSDECEVIVI